MAPAPRYGDVSPYLSIAIRAYTEPDRPSGGGGSQTIWPKAVLAFDCETTDDETQRLLFGSYRYLRVADSGRRQLRCVEEGLFHPQDLEEPARQTLADYVSAHSADVIDGVDPTLQLRTLEEFLERVLWRACWQHPARQLPPAALVGFNLPFDLSRLAYAVGEARGARRKGQQRRRGFVGGFSFDLYGYQPEGAERRASQYRPRVAIKTIDSKRHLMAFISPAEIDEPEIFDTGFRGHILDLRTIAFSLSDRGYSLARACQDWNVASSKEDAEEHGRITPEYIDYNRQDVKATVGLYEKLVEEYRSHPIELQPSRAYSPASIGKAYLRSMRISPPLARQPDFPAEVLGWSMTAYYGGRAECRIRRTPVPVVYLDFLSMYPTVNSLLGLWDLVKCERVNVQDATDQIQALLSNLTLESCYEQETWRQLVGLAEIEPNADLLPVRARYAHTTSPSWQIGVNPLTNSRPLWFAIPDVVASTLLTGRPPRIRRAIRLVPQGRSELQGIELAGAVAVNPLREDFFREIIQQRKCLTDRNLPPNDQARLERFLKVLANATSYGIYAEMVRHELARRQTASVRVRALEPEPFTTDTPAPEEPGEFCFPPMAACITAAARLMLALLEREVTDRGGTYAFCDTDSMAIVSTKNGGPVLCPGGSHRTSDGQEAVRALPWSEVEELRHKFQALNPYDERVPGSVLELEDQNFDDRARTERRQLHCYAISAKRYALYGLDHNGRVMLRSARKEDPFPGEKWSEHGLGHLLNPTDPESEDRDWIRQLWEHEIRRELGQPSLSPNWLDRRALGRVTVSKYRTLESFDTYNAARRSYGDAIKPFNFMLTAHGAIFGQPPSTEPEQLQLIAPWQPDPREWKNIQWINRDQPAQQYRAVTGRQPGAGEVQIKTYRDVLEDYRIHPEAKSLAPDGRRSGWHTRGLLKRRPVIATWLHYIGKESNELEEAEAGILPERADREVEYKDPREDEWELVRQVVKRMPRDVLIAHSGIDPGLLSRYINVKARPRPPRERELLALAARWATAQLGDRGDPAPDDHLDVLAAYLAHRP